MRRGFYLAALAFAGICEVSSAALAEVTGVTVSANAWDTRTTGNGCAPDGCVAANVLDDSIEPESRWSCEPSSLGVDVCELAFVFDEPQDIFEMRLAMYKGDERSRSVNVFVDGVLSTTVATSADTLEFEAHELSATQASTIVLQEAGGEENVWLSITGVQLMTDYDVDASGTGLVPTSDDYVGCYNDLVGDRVLTTVITDDALTPAVCAAACAETGNSFYGLQQGNECWCAGCDITELDTNTDYDRHGEGSCSTPCAGDSTSTCGGDFAISLYQATTCQCPSGSTAASLEITASWWDSYYNLELHVVEPGGFEVYIGNSDSLGEVGWMEDLDDEEGLEPGSETYMTLNGLSVEDDMVLGDYEIWAEGREGISWAITARSAGELLWVKSGVFSESQEETERMTATVTAYADSDCTLDSYGSCPPNTYGSEGLPPCTACAQGLVSSYGSTYCTPGALRDLDLPENIATTMIADAVGGWAGPGDVEFDDGDDFDLLFITKGEEWGTISVSGTYVRDDDAALPASTALYLYVHNENSETDFVRGQGVIDTTTGDFSATISDIPVGYSRGILSFVVLDADDTGDLSVGDSVFELDVINEGCSDALRIKLEWDSSDSIDMWITEPNGDRARDYGKITDIGYLNNRNGGSGSAGNPDTGLTYSFEEYVVFSGLSGDSMLGEYRVFARRNYSPSPNAWTLTATMNGEVVWTEEGVLEGSSSTTRDADLVDDDDESAGRRLFTDDSYSSTSFSPQTDVFTVTVGAYDPAGC